MESLRIVRDNDFYLMAPVRRIVFEKNEYGDEVKVGVRMHLDECSVLSVRLIYGDDEQQGISLPYVISKDDESKLIVKVLGGKLQEGWYGLEVKGIYAGRHFRSYERKTFKIVENNGKSYVSGNTYAGEASYQIDTMWVLYSCPDYAHLYIDTSTMNLMQKGTVENGELYLDDAGKLCMRVNN